jgi:hypothetical protein
MDPHVVTDFVTVMPAAVTLVVLPQVPFEFRVPHRLPI